MFNILEVKSSQQSTFPLMGYPDISQIIFICYCRMPPSSQSTTTCTTTLLIWRHRMNSWTRIEYGKTLHPVMEIRQIDLQHPKQSGIGTFLCRTSSEGVDVHCHNCLFGPVDYYFHTTTTTSFLHGKTFGKHTKQPHLSHFLRRFGDSRFRWCAGWQFPAPGFLEMADPKKKKELKCQLNISFSPAA